MRNAVIALGAALAFLVITVAVIFIYRRLPRKLRSARYQHQWKALQKHLAHKEEWGTAIIKADALLDEALRKKHCKGKSMGERLVSEEKNLSNHDAVWFGHKLANRLKSENPPKLRERDVKKALLGLGQGLKDVGAIK